MLALPMEGGEFGNLKTLSLRPLVLSLGTNGVDPNVEIFLRLFDTRLSRRLLTLPLPPTTCGEPPTTCGEMIEV